VVGQGKNSVPGKALLPVPGHQIEDPARPAVYGALPPSPGAPSSGSPPGNASLPDNIWAPPILIYLARGRVISGIC